MGLSIATKAASISRTLSCFDLDVITGTFPDNLPRTSGGIVGLVDSHKVYRYCFACCAASHYASAPNNRSKIVRNGIHG
jgi:hypothetical protein